MASAGGVVGFGGLRQLGWPWALAGLALGALGAAVGWQRPALFFENRR